jgi:serine/threonine protein kinase
MRQSLVTVVSFLSLVGFGVVWKAKYKGEPVAIKTIPVVTLTPDSIASLKNEASIMRKLAHPRIVSCFGIYENNGNYCMVMELLEGGSLHGYINEKPCPEGWFARYNIALDICHGMGYLHRLNVIHRDLKPGNVVLDRFGKGKITDFGLSVFKNTAVTSVKGQEIGTVQYMVIIFLYRHPNVLG